MANTPAQATPFYRRKPSRRTQVIAGVVLALVVLLLVLFDWNWFKGPLQAAVKAQTGREFRIGGDLHVDLGRVTTVSADGLTFANASWSEDPHMATANRAELDIELLPLLFRWQARIPEMRLDRPDLRLETGPEGQGNWVFRTQDREGGNRLLLQRLWIDGGRLRYNNDSKQTDVDISVDSAQSRREGGAPIIVIEGDGRWNGNDFNIAGRAESPLELSNSDAPYRIDLKANAGPTRAHARGNLVNPFQVRRFDLQLALSGQDLEDLFPLTGLATPSTPPYGFDGRFSRDGNVWRYRGFDGTIGDSDLGGDVEFTVGGERPRLAATLASDLLDMDDLAGFVGAAPDGESAAGTTQPPGRVLPHTPYDLGRLRAMDADVRLKASRIVAPGWPLDDMDAHLKLEAGQLRLDPLNFGVAGGDIRSTIRMDATGKVIRTRADATARGLSLDRLLPSTEAAKDAIGRVGGSMGVDGTGNSIAAMLGSADGEIAIGMGKGQVSNLLMELAGIDIYEALKFLITGDQLVPVRCAFGDFAVKGGVMQSRSLAFDTEDTIIIGKGHIDLGQETLDLELRPRPKDRSILSLRSPLVLDGTFKEPSFRPDMARLGLRGALALALGTIAPPAALLATIETGPGKDADCGGDYAR